MASPCKASANKARLMYCKYIKNRYGKKLIKTSRKNKYLRNK